LIAVAFLFLIGQAGVSTAIDLSSAINECHTACSIDTIKLKADCADATGECNFTTAPTSKFLELEFIIDGDSTPCVDITNCQLSVKTGGTCKLVSATNLC